MPDHKQSLMLVTYVILRKQGCGIVLPAERGYLPRKAVSDLREKRLAEHDGLDERISGRFGQFAAQQIFQNGGHAAEVFFGGTVHFITDPLGGAA